MVLELGPCPIEDVRTWSRFARRIIVELRACHNEGLVSPDVVDMWATILDQWSTTADELVGTDDLPFRWTGDYEPEVAEFLLDGLERCLHSPKVMGWVTEDEATRQRAFTGLVVKAFVDGLAAEGQGCQQFAAQINESLGSLLAD